MRSTRHLVLLITAPLLAMTACTTSPDTGPGPQPSGTISPCMPTAGDITWKPASDAGLRLLGVSEFVVAPDGATTRSNTVLDHGIELIDPSQKVLTEYRLQDRDDLLDALTEDVRRTGQVPDDFGGPVDPFSFADVGDLPEEGQYLMGFEVMTTRVPFEADCGGGLIEGSLQGPTSGGESATLLDCDFIPEVTTPVDTQLRSYC